MSTKQWIQPFFKIQSNKQVHLRASREADHEEQKKATGGIVGRRFQYTSRCTTLGPERLQYVYVKSRYIETQEKKNSNSNIWRKKARRCK